MDKKNSEKSVTKSEPVISSRSIARDLSLYLVFALAVILGFVTAYEYFSRSQMMHKEMQETADNYIQHLAQSAAIPVWNLDLASLKRMCDAYTTNGHFAFLKVIDTEGSLLYNFVSPISDGEYVERIQDIVVESEIIGKVRLGLSRESYNRTLERILFITSFTFLISVIVIYIITERLLTKFLKKPIESLLEGMDKVALGDFSYRFQKLKYSEMSQIAARFNRMIAEVASRERRLEEVNQALSSEIVERQNASESLIKSEKKYRALVETTSEGFMMINEDLIMMDVNPAFCQMLEYSRDEMLGNSLSNILGDFAAYSLREYARTGSEFELSVITKKGRNIDIYIHATKLFESESREMTFAFITDISEYKRLAEALKESEKEYRTIAENTHDWEMWIDNHGSLRYVSPSCERISGFTPDYFKIGPESVYEILHRDDRHIWEQFLVRPDDNNENLDMRLFRKDGLMCWVSISGHEVFDTDGESLGIRLSIRDITKRKFMEKQLHYEALHDPLTGLANRNLCLDRIIHALERASRREDYYFAVAFMDLDRFKVVNDSLGHAIGDKLLVEISSRLQKLVRELDTVSRFGGDEFILILEELSSPAEAVKIVSRIRARLKESVMVENHTLNIEASYGIVINPLDHGEPDRILQNANIAMHRAKESGRDKIKVFNNKMLDQAKYAMAMQNDIRKGITEEEFYLVYQPIYSFFEEKIIGFESLIRWNHPQKGLVMPGDFISLAEETGLIFSLGQWVFKKACEQTKELIQKHDSAKNIVVSINVSARQFSQANLIDGILTFLHEYKLSPRNIKVEITETAIVERADLAVEMLGRLKSAGVNVSIDDFGTGYSSMSNLQQFPLEQLKIDIRFIKDIDKSNENVEIVRAIINLAHNLGLEVVAEGIEREEQQNILIDLGCDYGQGYYYSKPLPFNKVDAYFKTGVLEKE